MNNDCVSNDLNNILLYEIYLKEFWDKSLTEKNYFYYYVKGEILELVNALKLDTKYSEDFYLSQLWERHCEMCFETITLLDENKCYCSSDGMIWLSSNCYNKNHIKFNWSTIKIDDNFAKNFIKMGTIISKI